MSNINMGHGCRCPDCKTDSGKSCSPINGNQSSCTPNKDCAAKPISSTLKDDGCFCRKCNDFLYMAEPDDIGDGKTLCYRCSHS